MTMIVLSVMCMLTPTTRTSEGPTLPWIVAHRGASHDAPENTLAAFRLAWERGADAIECDVRATADGKIVCLHDETTGRTTGGEKGAGIRVADATLEDLRGLEVGAWKDGRYAGERIPTLAEVLATVPEGKRVFVEVKAEPEAVPAIVETIAASGLADEQVVIISFNADVVRIAKAAMPHHTVNWLTGFEQTRITRRWEPGLATVLTTLRDSGADGLGCRAELNVLGQAFVTKLRRHGYGFHVWTVNDPETARRLIDLGVGSITTDRPGWLRDQLTTPPD